MAVLDVSVDSAFPDAEQVADFDLGVPVDDQRGDLGLPTGQPARVTHRLLRRAWAARRAPLPIDARLVTRACCCPGYRLGRVVRLAELATFRCTFGRMQRMGPGHGSVSEADLAFAAHLADWLARVLTDADVRLVSSSEDMDLLLDGIVRSLPPLLREATFPVALRPTHGEDVHGRLRSLLSEIPPDRRLAPTSSESDLRALIRTQVQPAETLRFYRLVFQGELADMLWNAFALAVRHLTALGSPARLTGPDADHLAHRLDALGLVERSAWTVIEAQHNEVPGTVNGPVIQAGTIRGGIHVSPGPREPGPGESPVVVTVTAVGKVFAVVEGDQPMHIPFSGEASVQVLVEATGARAVVLTRLRPVVLARRVPQPTRSVGFHLGGLGSYAFEALLDEEPPRLQPVPILKPSDPPMVRLLGAMFRSKRITDFPFTVAPLDPGLFLINPCTDRHDIEWQLELDWIYQGRRGTTLIDDNGHPFLVGPAHRP